MDDLRDQLPRRTADLEGSGCAVSRPLANRTAVQVVEVAQSHCAARTGYLAATANGGLVCQADRRDCTTLDPPDRRLERRPAKFTQGGCHSAALDRATR